MVHSSAFAVKVFGIHSRQVRQIYSLYLQDAFEDTTNNNSDIGKLLVHIENIRVSSDLRHGFLFKILGMFITLQRDSAQCMETVHSCRLQLEARDAEGLNSWQQVGRVNS